MTNLWRVNLNRLQEEFGEAGKRYPHLRCKVWHSEFHELPLIFEKGLLPKADPDLSVYGGLQTYGGMWGATRYVAITGDAQSRIVFQELAERAGRLVQQAPATSLPWVPANSIKAECDIGRWLWFVFDCAWCRRHPTLSAERHFWVRGIEPLPYPGCPFAALPYDLDKLRAMISEDSAFLSSMDFHEEWLEQLPGFYSSVLKNVLTASVDALDVLGNPDMSLRGRTHKRGRPSDTNHAEDKRFADGWKKARDAGTITTKAEYAREKGVPVGKLKAALERHRKR